MSESHFTYADDPNLNELQQGDVLKRTPQLESLIKQVHPHYTSCEYTHFQVITQSCDLVLYNGKCKTRYITIAATRSLETVIRRELDKFSLRGLAVNVDGEVFCSEAAKNELKDFLRKIINNQSKDFFYLNAAPLRGLESDSCTFLHLSIAIKAELHYEACLKSKILQLEDNFQSRLGWMVGNLYSRVGTKDFVPSAMSTEKEFSKHVDSKLTDHLTWVKPADFSVYKKNAMNEGVSVGDIKQKIEEEKFFRIKSGVDEIISILKRDIQIDPNTEKNIANRLSKNPMLISKFCKD